MQTITGVLRRWRRNGDKVSGYVYESDIWDNGEFAELEGGYLQGYGPYYLYVRGIQVYKLSKEDELKD